MARCRTLIARHRGLITREQALESGLTPRQIDTLLKSGRWRLVYRGVYADTAVPSSWEQSLLAAVIRGGPHAVASGRCAAALLDLPGFHRETVEITSPTRLRDVPFIAHLGLVPPELVSVHEGIPTTGAARTLIDIAGTISPERLADALDDALRRNLTSLAKLKLLAARIDGRGKRGLRCLRGLILERDDGRPIPESVLETRLWGPLKRLGAPAPLLQFPISFDGRDYRIDFAFPHAMVAVEAQSLRWHSDLAARKRDMEKANAIQVCGWRGPIYITWDDVYDPERKTFNLLRRMLLPNLFEG